MGCDFFRSQVSGGGRFCISRIGCGRVIVMATRIADRTMEVTKALAALQPLYGKGNIEIVTTEGIRVRGIVRSMKTTQALSTPTVKVERADGEIVKVPFTSIIEIINHNRPSRDA